MSPDLEQILAEYRALDARIRGALKANRSAHEDEAALEAEHKREWNGAFLRFRQTEEAATGKRYSEGAAKAMADLDVDETYTKLLAARALRRATQDALKVWQAELEVLRAAGWATREETKQLQNA